MSKNNQKDNPKTKNHYKRVFLPERQRPFVMISHDLFERGRHLSASAKWLFVVLHMFKNHQTGKTFPSYELIMKKSGLSKNGVANGLKELEHWNWLEGDKSKRANSKHGNNNYNFFYPAHVLVDTNEEVGDQTYPTKEMALEWNNTRKEKQKQKQKDKRPIEEKVKGNNLDTATQED